MTRRRRQDSPQRARTWATSRGREREPRGQIASAEFLASFAAGVQRCWMHDGGLARACFQTPNGFARDPGKDAQSCGPRGYPGTHQFVRDCRRLECAEIRTPLRKVSTVSPPKASRAAASSESGPAFSRRLTFQNAACRSAIPATRNVATLSGRRLSRSAEKIAAQLQSTRNRPGTSN
jgi:hypothetical protein